MNGASAAERPTLAKMCQPRSVATLTDPSERDLFDRWSTTYDRQSLQTFTYRPIHDAMLRRIREAEPRSILDLGCGTGQFLARLSTTFPSAVAVGVDLSGGMLDQARRRLGVSGGSSLARADALALPLQADSIEVVTCSESFHWYPNQAAALAEVARVLAPDGRLLIASIAATTDLGQAAIRSWSEAVGQPIRALPPRRLRGLLDRSGFDILQQRRIPRLGLIPWPVLTDARLRQ